MEEEAKVMREEAKAKAEANTNSNADADSSKHGGSISEHHDASGLEALFPTEAGEKEAEATHHEAENVLRIPGPVALVHDSNSSVSQEEGATGSSRSSQIDASAPIDSQAKSLLRKVARLLLKLTAAFGYPAYNLFDSTPLNHGRATEFPEIPAERARNVDLQRTITHWDQLSRAPSRAESPRPSSDRGRQSTTAGASPPPRRRDTLEVPSSPHPGPSHIPESSIAGAEAAPKRRPTLELPLETHGNRSRTDSSGSGIKLTITRSPD